MIAAGPAYPPLEDHAGEAERRGLTPVGSPEGAECLGVAPDTVEKCHERGIRPDPDWLVSAWYPACASPTWEAFGLKRGHLGEEHLSVTTTPVPHLHLTTADLLAAAPCLSRPAG